MVWKGDEVPISEGGSLVFREFQSLDKATKWLKGCEGEYEVFDLNKGEEALVFLGDVRRVFLDIRAELGSEGLRLGRPYAGNYGGLTDGGQEWLIWLLRDHIADIEDEIGVEGALGGGDLA